MYKSSISAISLCLLLSNYCAAEEITPKMDESDNKKTDSDWQLTMGLGMAYGSEITGLKKNKLGALPMFEVIWKDTVFFNPFDGLGFLAHEDEDSMVSLSIGYEPGRKEKKHKNLEGLGNIGDATVLFADLNYSFGPLNTFLRPSQYFGGSDGISAELGAELMMPLDLLTGKMSLDDMEAIDDPTGLTALHFGIGGLWGDKKFNQTYWGVDQQQAINSVYDEYQLDSGFYGWRANLGLMTPITDRWNMMLNLEHTQLSGKAADSPFVNQDDNTNIGVIFSYDF